MHIFCLWAVIACFVSNLAAERGGSLRGALEALQRRQRGRLHNSGPIVPQDYDTLYEFVPPQAYAEPDYAIDVEDVEEEPKYIVKLLDNESPSDAYEYKIIKKKNSVTRGDNKRESAFRERSQHSDNDRLRDLFMDRNELQDKEDISQERPENDADYAMLLGQLWSKYKTNKANSNRVENAPQGVIKLYKEKIVKKSFPNNWGPIAFKRKRSSGYESERPSVDIDESKIPENQDQENPNYNAYDVSDDDKDDMREEYAIAFQPLDDDSLSDLADEDQFAYENIEKRFPVSKRSGGTGSINMQKKRFALNNHDNAKTFRGSSGTDPKIIEDLSKIFDNSEYEIIKNPVKRSSDNVETPHEIKPPSVNSHDKNDSRTNSSSSSPDSTNHEHHGHPPGVTGKELEHDEHSHDHDHDHHNHDVPEFVKPKIVQKKSVDWSDYFGIDKRFKKSPGLSDERLKKLYFDTFNKEVVYPLNNVRGTSYMKRNFVGPKFKDSTNMIPRAEKRNAGINTDTKLENFDKKLKNMEGIIVDEALQYSHNGEELDSKEEQEMKEKLLSRLAAAYSLEKMRKALKEFKQSLQIQKVTPSSQSTSDGESKDKRVAVKKEKVIMGNAIPSVHEQKSEIDEDFEDEQGAGHYINGKLEEQLSEGYMGGSGRHRSPAISTVSSAGACPVLDKIIKRCRGVDLLAGDRGQQFLPLCSLHQICYLCGEAPPTTCDLVFLSEADSTCEGDMSCQRAARSALMALRELHDNLADELDGECEASPCLPATLKLNLGWQRALQR